MHEQCVLTTNINRQLANRFKERQGFDITYGTADFNQNHVMAFTASKNAFFDSVSDVRDNLYGRAQIVATALFAQDI